METSEKEISIKELILSFSVLGIIALIAILIWKRFDTLDFLAVLFDPSNLLINVLLGASSGIILALIATILVKITGTKMPKSNDQLIDIMMRPSGPVLVGALPGTFEELFFRGFLLLFSMHYTGTLAGVILSTLVFWAIHIPQYKTKIVLNLNVILLSILTSILVIETGSLWGAIFAHAVYNYLVTLAVQKKLIKV
ncbi:CPBP family intramembrane glutamic endopeptidase [Cytobacillus sp. FJAT-54145]|uniref:CPBP family intramembrane glutamic endopeptidase n=1 Tax=Cytobacillus spartinae TaxID=3299023 RepID=A0ABW6K930_9BACI